MLLDEVARVSLKVAETGARLQKISALAACLERMTADEVGIGVSFLSGELRQGRIGVGWASIRDATPEPASEPSLTLADADLIFTRIVQASGKGSSGERTRLLHELLSRATDVEQAFLRKLLTFELRQGAQQGVVLDALARAAKVPAASVRRAVMLSGDIGTVARAVLAAGADGLSAFRLELLRPIEPMLAQTVEDPKAALERLGSAALEYKLDGARVQLHRSGDEVRVFTRGLHDVTARVPELVELARSLPTDRVVLDGEAIALRTDGKPLPFQVTMRRFGRKLDVGALRESMPLTPVFFDILHAEGQDLIDRPAHERFAALCRIVPSAATIPRKLAVDASSIAEFSAQALAQGHEGIMVKSLEAPYEAGNRGASWLKLKPAHTLDLVVLAAEWGSGRRHGWLSNLHLGARDPKTNGFVMLGKTFKGMTDAMLKWQTEHLLGLELAREGHIVHVRPELVVEVAFDGVQQSSHYPGGLALRFARVKSYRTDKRADEADVIDSVRAIHARSHGSEA
jgi:DNA ligase 1